MDISCQEPLHFHNYISSSSVQLCTRDVHRDLQNGNTESLNEWLNNGKSARYFIKRAISYPYRVRYEMMRTLCRELVNNTVIPHTGYYTFGRKRLYEWTFLEIVQRCHHSLYVSEPDEIWAFYMISSGKVPISTSNVRWNSILQVFDGSLRWVRLLAAFLCSVSTLEHPTFDRVHMVNGWVEWMDTHRIYELLRCIYPTFSHTAPADVIHVDKGEIPMMGLVWACKHDDPIRHTTRENDDQSINDGISAIFTDDYIFSPTGETDSMGEEELDS